MLRRLAPLVLCLGLAACAGTPRGEPPDAGLPGGPDNELELALLLGEIALQRNQLGEAAVHYGAAANRSDSSDVAQRATAVAFQAGREDIALESAERWRALAPQSLAANRYLAVLRLRQGDLDGASEAFTSVVLLTEDPTVAFDELLTILGAEERRRSAAEVMEALVEDYPDEPMAQFALARLALMAARPRLALTAAERLSVLDADWPRGQLTLAQALLAAGEREAALTLARRIIADADADTELRLELAGLLTAAGLEEEALSQLEKLRTAEPDNEDVVRALALVRLRAGELATSEQLWNELRQGFRHSVEASYYLGRIAREQGRDFQAIRSLSRVTTGPQVVEAQVLVALIYEASGDLEAALQHLRDFAAASPRHADAMRIAAARLLVDAGRDEEALALFDQPLAERPGDERLLAARAGVFGLVAQRQIDEGAYRDALSTYRRGLAVHPDEPLLLYQRALLYERMDRVRQAIREFERLVRMEPESPVFLNALGYTLADRTREYARARSLIEQALERAPDNAAIIDSMGWVLFRLGDLDGALEYLLHAWSLLRDPEVAAHIVEVRLARGEEGEALEMLQEALERWPGDRHLEPWRERLMP